MVFIDPGWEPGQEFTSEQIEDAMSTLSDVGIQMTEGDDSGGYALEKGSELVIFLPLTSV